MWRLWPLSTEYPNFLRRQNKEFLAILYDDESVTTSDSDDEIHVLVGCNSTNDNEEHLTTKLWK